MNKTEKLKLCVGCRQNFYNGNNGLGVKECWSLKTAKLVLRKRVHISQVPPWKQSPVKVFQCRREEGFVFTDPKKEY
jgi:hypothetical protein